MRRFLDMLKRWRESADDLIAAAALAQAGEPELAKVLLGQKARSRAEVRSEDFGRRAELRRSA
jgi:hypothetical protein